MELVILSVLDDKTEAHANEVTCWELPGKFLEE